LARRGRRVLAHHEVQSVLMMGDGRWRIAPRVPHTAWQLCALVALALAASWIGVQNGFTYDDRYIIEWNARVHSIGGGQWWRLFGQSYWPKDWGSDGY